MTAANLLAKDLREMRDGVRTSEISEWGLHERQMQAFLSPATELLFGGASEGGKSFFIRYALCVWCAAIPNLSCVIIRRHYGDVVGNHMQGPTSFHSMLRQWVKDKLVTITENEVRFNFNGSTIRLTGLLYEKDLEKEQGREKSVLVVDEATQIPWRFIEGLRGWVRIPKAQKDLLGEQLKDIYPHISAEARADLFPRIIYTANPIGQSVGAFRRAFITPREPFAIEKVGAFTRQYIPSRVTDNPEADPEAQRLRLESFGEATAHALITGDWNSPCGDFYPEYDDALHSVPDFTPPKTWFKYRSFDWGGSDPACCYWWCVSDGEEFTDDTGKKRWFPRGAIIAYREWYICNPDDPAKGLNLRNEDIAREIVKRTPETTSNITLTDRFPFADRGASKNGAKYTMADDFFENGCPLTLGNVARVFGWKQLRSRLQGIKGVPMIYIVKSCKYLRDYIPALPYHDTKREDAAESGESTHACDAARLACTARPLITDVPPLPDFSERGKMRPKDIITRFRPPAHKKLKAR